MSRRLLQVVRSLRAETGGVAAAARAITEQVRARGHTVTFASLDPADRGAPDVHAFGRHSEGYGYAAHFTPWLRERRGDFDAVIVHGMWQYPGFGTWRALRGTSTPYHVFCHGMNDPWFKRTYPLKHAKKWLYWPWAEYRVLRDARSVLFTTDEERRLARQSFPLYRAAEGVVPLGVAEPPPPSPTLAAAWRAAAPAVADRPFFLFLGRVHVKKGLEELLRAYAATSLGPDLVIAGPCAEPAYQAQLVTLTRSLSLEARVHWVPMLTGDAKWGALHAAEAFVLTSHQENFGIAVVEALACGRPVLISESVNLARELAAAGAALVAPDTVAGATDLLRRWQDTTPAERSRMADAARRCHATRYSPGVATDALLAALGW
jgi:glycosyltransferase involved in cell wall biosynthesis